MYDVHIRFSDIDAFGHVHNAAYFHFFESARIQCFEKLLGNDWDWNSQGFMVVDNHAQYHTPTYLKDAAKINLNVTKIGTKSFSMRYQLWVKDRLNCTGNCTIVCYNHSIKQSIVIPEKLKTLLNQLS